MIDPEALQLVDRITRTGSFAQAARELGRVPSAVTYTIRKLEEELDVLLFDRRGRHAKLTAAGQVLLDEGQHVLRQLEDLAEQVRRTGSGWEVELRIAVDTVISWAPLYDLVERFDALGSGTRLRFQTEVLQGTWDALLTGRADLAIGLPDEGPMRSGFQVRRIGQLDFIFCVAPQHPLAEQREPISLVEVSQHRSITVADSSRRLDPRTTGVLPGQTTLTVPTMREKLEAQLRGLGCGWLPEPLARQAIEQGRLIPRRVAGSRPITTLHAGWRSPIRGKALQWWVEQLDTPRLREALSQAR